MVSLLFFNIYLFGCARPLFQYTESQIFDLFCSIQDLSSPTRDGIHDPSKRKSLYIFLIFFSIMVYHRILNIVP